MGLLLGQVAAATQGALEPVGGGLTSAAVIVSSAVLVSREGLEAIVVLAAVTAGLARSGKGYERGVVVGSGLALLATVATWFIVVAVISEVNASELHIQAATGL